MKTVISQSSSTSKIAPPSKKLVKIQKVDKKSMLSHAKSKLDVSNISLVDKEVKLSNKAILRLK